jgi:hypothetical protein
VLSVDLNQLCFGQPRSILLSAGLSARESLFIRRTEGGKPTLSIWVEVRRKAKHTDLADVIRVHWGDEEGSGLHNAPCTMHVVPY